MDSETGLLETILELESRHDDLLHRLAELDQRVQETLKEYSPRARGHTEGNEESSPPVETS